MPCSVVQLTSNDKIPGVDWHRVPAMCFALLHKSLVPDGVRGLALSVEESHGDDS